MITASTKDGFAVELDEEALDYITLELLVKSEKDFTCYFKAVDRFLGEENKNKLLEHLADKNGRVPQEAMTTAFEELANSFKEGKNSSSSPN